MQGALANQNCTPGGLTGYPAWYASVGIGRLWRSCPEVVADEPRYSPGAWITLLHVSVLIGRPN
jgi:hypothetical protein